MRQILPILLIAGTAGAMLYYSSKKKFANAVRFQLKEIKISNANILAKVSILNPTNQTATITSIVGTFYYNNKPIATIKNFYKVQIVAGSETDLILTFVPSLAGVLASLADLATGKKIKGFKVVGNAMVDGILVPINFSS